MILRKFLSPLVVTSSTSPSRTSTPSSSLSSSSSTFSSSLLKPIFVPHQKVKDKEEKPNSKNNDNDDDSSSNGFNHWYLHHTFQKRKYQCDIIREALFQNVLISIPHRFGRKYVASAIMLNFFRWFPQGKTVFVSNLHSSFSSHIKLCRKFGIERVNIYLLVFIQ